MVKDYEWGIPSDPFSPSYLDFPPERSRSLSDASPAVPSVHFLMQLLPHKSRPPFRVTGIRPRHGRKPGALSSFLLAEREDLGKPYAGKSPGLKGVGLHGRKELETACTRAAEAKPQCANSPRMLGRSVSA